MYDGVCVPLRLKRPLPGREIVKLNDGRKKKKKKSLLYVRLWLWFILLVALEDLTRDCSVMVVALAKVRSRFIWCLAVGIGRLPQLF